MSLRTLLNTLRASLVRKQSILGSIRGRRSSSRVCQTLEVRALLSVDIAPIIDINQTANAGSSAPQDLVDVEGTVYFIASTTATGAELWKSDGTANGTTLVKDIKAGSDLSNA